MGGSSSSNSRSTIRGPTGTSIRTWCYPESRLPRMASRRWTCRNSGWATPSTAAPTENSNFHSAPGTFGSTPFKLAGGINAPEGINTLRFGGVDTTFTPTGGTPLNQTNQNNEFVINLGPPIQGGTSIIVNKVITDAGSTTSSARRRRPSSRASPSWSTGGSTCSRPTRSTATQRPAWCPPSSSARPHRQPACCREAPTWSPTWEEASRPDRSAISGSAATPRTSRPWRWRRISSRSLRPTRRPALR